MLRKLNQKAAPAHIMKCIAMNFTRRREYHAAPSKLALLSMIEFSQAAFEHDIKRRKVVRVPGYLEPRRMRCFSSKETGDLLLAQMILTQSHRHLLIVVLCSTVCA